MDEPFDFLAFCQPGMTLTTGDRRPVRITEIDKAAGLIRGEVAMFGACVWRADGLWQDAPCGARGPLDLAPPSHPTTAAPEQRRASVVAALEGPNRHFCCD
ncbi:MAG: hypothetical protein SGJ07_14045 [Rhodospirillaceae bacterium]|nr:hypothetical protein [Rhodospirillaceae bacterium]